MAKQFVSSLGRRAEDSSTRIREFLLQGPSQQHSGDHRGAVAGTLDADGSAVYVYGEITGYYLHWLASLPMDQATLFSRAEAAQAWLQGYLHSTSMPLTRVYLHAAAEDWRNQALFAFDLAMIAGGLARASCSKLIGLSPAMVTDLQHWLLPFVDDSGLTVCLPRQQTSQLPQRWSTTGGSFTAKTASRILLLQAETALHPALVQACRTELQTRVLRAEQHGIDMLHPTLYGLEGCMTSPTADFERLAHWFDQIIALQADDGSLPESPASASVRRTDIIAQALRVAVFLESVLAQPGRYREACDAFAQALLLRVHEDGSIAFSTDSNNETNVWCAMFAEQALRLYAAYAHAQPLPFTVEALV